MSNSSMMKISLTNSSRLFSAMILVVSITSTLFAYLAFKHLHPHFFQLIPCVARSDEVPIFPLTHGGIADILLYHISLILGFFACLSIMPYLLFVSMPAAFNMLCSVPFSFPWMRGTVPVSYPAWSGLLIL